MSSAAVGHEQVRALVFVNGWMPDEGESIQQLFESEGPFAGSLVPAATQRPWSGAGYAGPSGPPGWRSIPSWYLVGTEDRAIPPAGQHFMAERGNAQIEEVAASHASMVSQPEAVIRLILSAVEATSRSQP
jgi:hypothetical protein